MGERREGNPLDDPATNAELARLAYVEALRGARHAAPAEKPLALAHTRAVTPVERLTALLLPELPTCLWAPPPRPAPTS